MSDENKSTFVLIILILFLISKYWDDSPDPSSITDYKLSLGLPNNISLAVICVTLALVLPFIGRLCWVPVHGWTWFTEYSYNKLDEILFIIVLCLVPAAIWYLSGKISKDSPLAFWFSISGGTAFLLHAYGTLNLHSSSTAGIALFSIPFYAIGAIGISWLLGRFICSFARVEKIRLWAAGIAGSLAVFYGVAFPIAKGVFL